MPVQNTPQSNVIQTLYRNKAMRWCAIVHISSHLQREATTVGAKAPNLLHPLPLKNGPPPPRFFRNAGWACWAQHRTPASLSSYTAAASHTHTHGTVRILLASSSQRSSCVFVKLSLGFLQRLSPSVDLSPFQLTLCNRSVQSATTIQFVKKKGPSLTSEKIRHRRVSGFVHFVDQMLFRAVASRLVVAYVCVLPYRSIIIGSKKKRRMSFFHVFFCFRASVA